MRGLADQDLAGARSLLQPRGHVDGGAGRERRFGLVDDDLAGFDADPRLELHLVHPVDDRERRADRSFGVVLVGLRDAEGGHDCVAGEFLHRAAVGLDAAGDAFEVGRHAPPDDLGVSPRDQVGVVDEVDEEDGRQLPFHA